MQSVLSRIWTCFAMSISYDDITSWALANMEVFSCFFFLSPNIYLIFLIFLRWWTRENLFISTFFKDSQIFTIPHLLFTKISDGKWIHAFSNSNWAKRIKMDQFYSPLLLMMSITATPLSSCKHDKIKAINCCSWKGRLFNEHVSARTMSILSVEPRKWWLQS